MRPSSLTAMGVLMAGLLASPALAYSNGITGYSGKTGVTCTACHGPGATPPSIELTGPSSLAAGATGSYVLTLRDGPAVVGGANIAVSNTAATLTPAAGSGMERRDSELVHGSSRPFTGNTLRFEFTLTAPSTGSALTLFAAGNSANGNSGNTEDGIATTRLEITVTGGTPATPSEPVPPKEEERGCASAGGSPGWVGLLLAGLVFARRARVPSR